MSVNDLLRAARDDGGTETWMVVAECLAAQRSDREISDGCARTIAAWYAEGMDTGQSFATTGAISSSTDVYRALFYLHGDRARPLYPTMAPHQKLCADMLGTYLTRAGVRGPQEGWSSKWAGR